MVVLFCYLISKYVIYTVNVWPAAMLLRLDGAAGGAVSVSALALFLHQTFLSDPAFFDCFSRSADAQGA